MLYIIRFSDGSCDWGLEWRELCLVLAALTLFFVYLPSVVLPRSTPGRPAGSSQNSTNYATPRCRPHARASGTVGQCAGGAASGKNQATCQSHQTDHHCAATDCQLPARCASCLVAEQTAVQPQGNYKFPP